MVGTRHFLIAASLDGGQGTGAMIKIDTSSHRMGISLVYLKIVLSLSSKSMRLESTSTKFMHILHCTSGRGACICAKEAKSSSSYKRPEGENGYQEKGELLFLC